MSFSRFSLKAQFLFFPSLLALVTILLFWAGITLSNAYRSLVDHFIYDDFSYIEQLSDYATDLESIHFELISLLEQPNIEAPALYEAGSMQLDRLHQLIREIEQHRVRTVAFSTGEVIPDSEVNSELIPTLNGYLNSQITALEAYSVHPAVSEKFLRKAERSYLKTQSFIASHIHDVTEEVENEFYTERDAMTGVASWAKQIAAILLLMSILGSFLYARRLARSIESVRNSLMRLASGDVSAPMPTDVEQKDLRSMVDALERYRDTQIDLSYTLAELESIQHELEKRVVERTERLSETNQQLEKEIVAKEAAKEALLVYQKVVAETDEAIVVTDANANIIEVNDAYVKTTGFDRNFVIGKNPSVGKSGRHDLVFYQNMWDRLLNNGRWSGEVWDRRNSGEIYPKWLTINAVKDSHGKTTNYIGIFRDIGPMKETERKLEQLAFNDALTNLANRTQFNLSLKQEVARAKRYGDKLGLMFIDLDGFKFVNDSLGHATGDLLLKEVAKRFTNCVRESDTLCRIGGDEFTVIATRIKDSYGLSRLAEELIESLVRPIELAGQKIRVGASIGISMMPEDSENMDTLIRQADIAMYEAKRRGKGTYCFASDFIDKRARTWLTLNSDIRNAITEKEFVLYYQPVINMKTGTLCSAEALIRWPDKSGKLRVPAEFIPFAEDNGIIEEIDQLVLEMACEQVKQWRPRGINLKIGVNLSAKHFESDHLLNHLEDVAEHYPHVKESLMLELTETALMHDPESASLTMVGISRLGIDVALDDFGTGYSSLGYLLEFPVTTVKIDRSFVGRLSSNDTSTIIPRTIIELAHNLGMKVVAEGVETREQHEFLFRHGCDFAQGYYYGRPMPASDLEALVQGDMLEQARPPQVAN